MTIDTSDGFVPRFLAQARSGPDKLFARYEGQPVTFGWMHRASSAVAAELRHRGVRRGDRVAVMLRNSPVALAVLYGLAKAGAIWVPVNVQQRGEGLRYVIGHAEPALAIVEDDLLPVLAESGVSFPSGALAAASELPSWLAGEEDFDELAPGADETYAIMYTSGTTGPPKGVMVSHRMLLLAGEGAALVARMNDGDVLLVWEPLYHIGGAQLLVVPLLRRVVLAMIERFSATRLWLQARENGASHIHFLGGILQILLKQVPTAIDRTHGARIAWGGGCPADIWRPFEERFGTEICECYGMTEASSITTYNDQGLLGSVGRPVPWLSVELRDEVGRAPRQGERGEIVVRENLPGAITKGYFRNPQATAKALRDGALHTGDLGSFDAAGNLYFHGRMTDSVRCRGENVSAWEVERVAAAHPAVEDCAMIGVKAEIGEQDIKLFVKPRAGAAIDLTVFSAWMEQRLAPYQNPRYLAVVDEFERTPSLRIMKHKLSRALDDGWDRLAAGAAARGSTAASEREDA